MTHRAQEHAIQHSEDGGIGADAQYAGTGWPLHGDTIEYRSMENREISRCLAETADLMEIAGEDSFRIRSYRNGATAVESYPERVADIIKNPDRKITDIPGIGKGLAAVLAEILERGSCERRDRSPPK